MYTSSFHHHVAYDITAFQSGPPFPIIKIFNAKKKIVCHVDTQKLNKRLKYINSIYIEYMIILQILQTFFIIFARLIHLTVLLGAIGTLKDRNGLKEILDTVYSENVIVHMMRRKSVQQWPLAGGSVSYMSDCRYNHGGLPWFLRPGEGINKLYRLMVTGENGLDSFFVIRLHLPDWQIFDSQKEWTGRLTTGDQLPAHGRNCSRTCYHWSNGVMGDASSVPSQLACLYLLLLAIRIIWSQPISISKRCTHYRMKILSYIRSYSQGSM